jgi:acyl-CoA reductase-like NAD-dependent aldehyde dehydrogenase
MEQHFLTFVSPATGEQFGQVAMATEAEVIQARAEMGRAFREWSQKPVTERVRILRQLQAVIIDSLDEITAVLNQDCGKSRQDGLIEAFMTVDMLDQYCKRAPRWLRMESVSRGLYLFKQCTVEHRPYGVVAVIAPWNYPFALALPPVIAALLAGNTVLLKPSEVTAAAGVMMEQLFQRVPELAPYVRVLHGDGAVGSALVQSAPDYIFLTGSTPTGRKVLRAAAELLIPAACELGGKDAMIVLEDADLEQAAHWGAWGAFFNAGQTCMAVERVYVVAEVYDRFLALALAETGRLKIGCIQDEESPFYLGPVTDPRQVKIIQSHLEDALARGARVLAGGQTAGMFIEPTVLVDVDHSMLVMRAETFGPLMPIMKVKDEAEAIRLANDCSYGLGASVWSADLERARRVAHQIEAASIIINDTIAQFAVPMLPFGGLKHTGYGRVHGKEGLMQFTRPYAYAVGGPPPAWDIATILRKPGHYRLGSALMRVLFGRTPRQRLQPLLGTREAEAGQREKRPARRSLTLGLAILGASGALAGVGLARWRTKRVRR